MSGPLGADCPHHASITSPESTQVAMAGRGLQFDKQTKSGKPAVTPIRFSLAAVT